MIRVLNFFCVALMGLSILALYHVSEQTRVARVELRMVQGRIADEKATTAVLQAEWERVANLTRIQHLAETRLGMGDTASIQLSSLELLPRRGDDTAPLGNSPVREASAQIPVPTPSPAEATQGQDQSGF
jgi:cell division protein FtsL